MPYDSAATRAGLLGAAYAEFSERRLAGALFDALNASPDLVRLTRRRGLERDDVTLRRDRVAPAEGASTARRHAPGGRTNAIDYL